MLPFLQPDPVYDVMSQYSYARNNPAALWDRGGMQTDMTEAEADASLAQAETLGQAFGAAWAASLGAALGSPFGGFGAVGGAVGGAALSTPASRIYGDRFWLKRWQQLPEKQRRRLLPKAKNKLEDLKALEGVSGGGGGGGIGGSGGEGSSMGSLGSLADFSAIASLGELSGLSGAGAWAGGYSALRSFNEFGLWGMSSGGGDDSSSSGLGVGGGSPGSCGLLGIEPVLLLAALTALRRYVL